MLASMLKVQSLAVGYKDRPVLEDLNFEVRRGEVVALIGPNGAGKTTLIRAVSGVLSPAHGEVYLDGRPSRELAPKARARLLAVVPQSRDLPADFTVLQTVLLGRTPYLDWFGRVSPGDLACVRQALQQAGLEGDESRRVGELSGGEQQRVLLARALAQHTPALLLDEPTSHLDLQYQSHLLNLVRHLAHTQNLAVLMAVHDLNMAALHADRVALLVEGRLHAIGAPQQVLTPALIQEAYHIPVQVIPHPQYGLPLVLPDGRS